MTTLVCYAERRDETAKAEVLKKTWHFFSFLMSLLEDLLQSDGQPS